jgi:GST-like protein
MTLQCAPYAPLKRALPPWRIVQHERQSQNLDDFPHVKRWFEAIKARPAVVRAYEWGEKIRNPGVNDETRKVLFGQPGKPA